jgi:prepilin-type N-terminal cleavage/methylation domain-containing protein
MFPVHQRQRAVTLVELTVSMAIMGVITLGLTSALMMATYTIDDGTSSRVAQREPREVAGQIRADLTYALGFTERTPRAVTFTAPDRTGDSSPETIRYAWSGIAGDSLTREYNAGGAVSIADDVHDFDLSYLLRTTPPPAAGCGDGTCDAEEDQCTCPDDCGAPDDFESPTVTCDDRLDNDCDGVTDCDDLNCGLDPSCEMEVLPQPSLCPNTVCEPGEDCISCPADCPGITTGKPSLRYCCGNGVLESAEGDGTICNGNP